MQIPEISQSMLLSNATDVVVIFSSILVAIINFIAIIVVIVRLTARWSRMESNQKNLVSRVDQLVSDKDKVHSAMIDSLGKLNDRQWELHALIRRERT